MLEFFKNKINDGNIQAEDLNAELSFKCMIATSNAPVRGFIYLSGGPAEWISWKEIKGAFSCVTVAENEVQQLGGDFWGRGGVGEDL